MPNISECPICFEKDPIIDGKCNTESKTKCTHYICVECCETLCKNMVDTKNFNCRCPLCREDWSAWLLIRYYKIEEKEGYEDDIDNHIHLNAPFTCLGVYEWDDVITDLPSITIEQSYTCYCYNTPRETEYFTITADIITNKVVMDYLIEKEFDPACNHSFLEGFHKKENGYWEIMLGS